MTWNYITLFLQIGIGATGTARRGLELNGFSGRTRRCGDGNFTIWNMKTQATMRRAISTAYYTLFHLLIESACSNWPERNAAHRSSIRSRRMKEVSQAARTNSIEHPDLFLVSSTVCALQDVRHIADYDLSVRILCFDVEWSWMRLTRSFEGGNGSRHSPSLRIIFFRCSSKTKEPDSQSPQMPRRASELPPRLRAQSGVHFFQRSEKAGERLLKMDGPTASLPKVALAKLIRARDDRCTHRPVLVCSLDPRQIRIGINPESESHTTNRTWRSINAVPMASRQAQASPLCRSLEASRYGRQADGR